LELLEEGSCVVLCSTVTATWAKSASEKFKSKGIDFLDCPISGGPVRAAAGDLTIMASGEDKVLDKASSILESMGESHIIQGGAGMGSTVKMVHQLLAGVHVCAAAEALALAAKAGLDVEQMYNIVNSAAGASWMFKDRGQRMISAETEEVKSALAIFVKDLDIVYSEAKSLGSPIPLASSALQQFITGQALGYGRNDDSQVVKVYENATNVPVAKVNTSTCSGGDTGNIGDTWKMQDGTEEVIVDMVDDSSHETIISNAYIRAFIVSLSPKGVSGAHRHAKDTLYFYLTEGGTELLTHVQGFDEIEMHDKMEFGEVCYESHGSDKAQVQKITNVADKQALYITIEILKQPPVVAASALVADYHSLIQTGSNFRVYQLVLQPGETVSVSYSFFYCTIILQPSTIKIVLGGSNGGGIEWEELSKHGDVQWREPCLDLKQTNIGESQYSVFVVEWV